ncbi:MAG: hypothetical protein ACRELG_25680 [Gemmataceae bacterium]
MLDCLTLFRLLVSLGVVFVALGPLPKDSGGAPAPKPKPPSALLFFPKRPNRPHYRRYQINMLRGSVVLRTALSSLKAADLPSLKKQENPAGWLSRKLKLESLDGTTVLRLSVTAGSRREQALLVNAIAQAYFKVEVPEQRQDAERTLEKMQTHLKSMQKLLDGLRSNPNRQRAIQGMEDDVRELKVHLKWIEADLRTPPLLLELADVPPK